MMNRYHAFLNLAISALVVAIAPSALAASTAAPLCDYTQLYESKRLYATIPDGHLSKKCVQLRDDTANLIRAPLNAIDYATTCTVQIETVSHPSASSACTFVPTYEKGDRFQIREWNGELTLTIRRANIEQLDIALNQGKLINPDDTTRKIKGVPWLWGVRGNLKYYVFLEHEPNGDGINKIYRLEVFDVTDPKWVLCSKHVPETHYAEVDCKEQIVPGTPGQESDTGGGGEPPTKPR